MTGSIGWGLAGVLIAGILNGSFVVPMKWMRAWQWENTWLLYSVVGLLIVPLALAFATVPRLPALMALASSATLIKVLLFGFGWGIGSVLFGLGVTRLGLALGYGVILGLVATVGSLLPLVLLHPDHIWTQEGLMLFAGMLLVIIGIIFCALAGRNRERETSSPRREKKHSRFFGGLLICILAGIFSAMLNLAFTFGAAMQKEALSAGVRPGAAANGLWALTLTAGFLANGGYCVYLLQKNRSWHLYSRGAARATYWFGGSLMGIVCFASFIVYGLGATSLGPLGGVVGWPLLMAMSLITANAWGLLTGEWKGASRSSHAYLLAGVAVLICAIAVISLGNR
ncbi:MAG: L-rhamnose/proton symporter RhaT [Terriglobia bacterium]